MSVFSQRLRELRGDQNQADFAEMLGFKAAAYGHYETGRREPSIDVILQVVGKTGVKLEWLLGASTAPSSPAAPGSKSEFKTLHCYPGECQECKKKAIEIARLNKIIDKLLSK